MALGYAKSRPAVHPKVIDRVRDYLRIAAPVRSALDIGCGAGVSTAALQRIAPNPVGIEPHYSMLRYGSTIAPGAYFAAGTAERMPIRTGSMDLITAAGSLNFVDLQFGLPEIRRVLRNGGRLVIYDFAQGSDFADSDRLTIWHREFKTRYPPPASRPFHVEALNLNKHGLELIHIDSFAVGLEIAPDFYVGYAMTETNVAAAAGSGTPHGEIREWCRQSIAQVFGGEAHEVLFKGYIAYAGRT